MIDVYLEGNDVALPQEDVHALPEKDSSKPRDRSPHSTLETAIKLPSGMRLTQLAHGFYSMQSKTADSQCAQTSWEAIENLYPSFNLLFSPTPFRPKYTVTYSATELISMDSLHAAYFRSQDDTATYSEPSTTSTPVVAQGKSPESLSAQHVLLYLAKRRMSPSSTCVMEAVLRLIEEGFLNIPGTRRINSGQARAVLKFGRWLQAKMLNHRVKNDILTTASVTEPDGLFALIGPGGTGESHVVLICRSLAEHFFGIRPPCDPAPSQTQLQG